MMKILNGVKVTVTKIGGVELGDNRRLDDEEGGLSLVTDVEFSAVKVVACDNGDCSSVDDDVIVNDIVQSFQVAVDGDGEEGDVMTTEIEEAAEAENMLEVFGDLEVEAGSAVVPTEHTAVEVARGDEEEDEEEGGGILDDLPIDIDFDQCDAGEGESPTCGFFDVGSASLAINQFSTCTGWSLTEVIDVVTGGAASFAEVIEACGGAGGSGGGEGEDGDIQPPDAGCVAAITELATDEDNPLRPFISDLVTDPQKYCNCNKKFYDDVPSCQFSGVGDLGQAKRFSCYFDEICDEVRNERSELFKGLH
jgi:hypothetical protein